MKHRIFTALLASLIALSPLSANAQESKFENWNPKQETEILAKKNNSRTYYGYISAIYDATDNPDVLELEIQAYITDDGSPYYEEYLAYSYGDDWEINDNVLLIVNTNGTVGNKSDDIVRDVIYVNPDFENGNQN